MNKTILPIILTRLKRSSNASFRSLELDGYPKDKVSALVSSGVLVRDGVSLTTRCADSDCGKTHEIQWLNVPDGGQAVPYYDCRGRERTYVDPDKLQQYRVGFGAFADGLARSIGSSGSSQTTGNPDVRRLGTLRLDARPRDAFLIRGEIEERDADIFSDSIVILIRDTIGRGIVNAAATLLAQECCRLEAGGVRLDVDIIRESITGIAPASSASKYLFRERGDFWEIAFGGEPILLENTVGLRYIRQLLCNQGIRYSALLLMHGEKHGFRVSTEASGYDQSLTLYDRDGSGIDNHAIMDSQYARDCVKYAEKLRSKLDRAKRKCDGKSVARLSEEIDVLRKLLNEGTAPGGRRRTFNSDRNKARSAVRDAVGTVRHKLRSRLPRLYDHFEEALYMGTECIYKPSEAIDWTTGED